MFMLWLIAGTNLKLLAFSLGQFVQVLVADINIGYEDIVNTQVRMAVVFLMLMMLKAGLGLPDLNSLFCARLPDSCFQWRACEESEELGHHGRKLRR